MNNNPNPPSDPQPPETEQTTTSPITTSSASDKIVQRAGEWWEVMRPKAIHFTAWLRARLLWFGSKIRTWWRPLSPGRKVLVLLALISPVVVYSFKKNSDRPFELTIPQPGSVPYEFSLIDAADDTEMPEWAVDHNLPLSRASLLRPFGVVVRFYQLVPKQAYRLTCEVEDASGTKIKGTSPVNLNSGSTEGWAYFAFTPQREIHVPGNWKARINISGAGVLEYTFEVQGPTSEEAGELANHEEAEKQAIRAFAHFWVVVPHQKIKSYVTANAEAESTDVLKRYTLFQIAGMEYKNGENYVTQTDRLNGISYLGMVGFGFTMYRSYRPESGWTEWKDVSRPENVISDGVKRLMGADYADPETKQQAPAMRFKVECRDGNWIVSSSEAARFINGTRKDDPKERSDFLAMIHEQERANEDKDKYKYRDNSDKQIFSGEVFQPQIEFVSKVSEDGPNKRADLQRLAKDIEASPETLKAQQKLTIETMGN